MSGSGRCAKCAFLAPQNGAGHPTRGIAFAQLANVSPRPRSPVSSRRRRGRAPRTPRSTVLRSLPTEPSTCAQHSRRSRGRRRSIREASAEPGAPVARRSRAEPDRSQAVGSVEGWVRAPNPTRTEVGKEARSTQTRTLGLREAAHRHRSRDPGPATPPSTSNAGRVVGSPRDDRVGRRAAPLVRPRPSEPLLRSRLCCRIDRHRPGPHPRAPRRDLGARRVDRRVDRRGSGFDLSSDSCRRHRRRRLDPSRGAARGRPVSGPGRRAKTCRVTASIPRGETLRPPSTPRRPSAGRPSHRLRPASRCACVGRPIWISTSGTPLPPGWIEQSVERALSSRVGETSGPVPPATQAHGWTRRVSALLGEGSSASRSE